MASGAEEVDVVVVGAGLAGLYAARTLQNRAPQLKVPTLISPHSA